MVALFAIATTSASARAQQADTSEPIKIKFDAPKDCPNEAAFAAEIHARTARARLAAPGEAARTFKVEVVKQKGKRHGTLHIEDAGGATDVREVDGTKCSEVVSALSLIAALAIDPHAVTGAVAVPGSLPGALPAVGGAESALSTFTIPVKMPWYAGLGPNPGLPALRLWAPYEPWVTPIGLPLPVIPEPDQEEPVHVRVRFGAQIGAATALGPAIAGVISPYAEILVDRSSFLSPALRLSFLDGFSTSASTNTGTGTFHFIGGRLEACPVRAALGESVAIVPCAALTAGALEASGNATVPTHPFSTSVTRPWVDVPILARVELSLLKNLVVEGQAGLLFPLIRDHFVLQPVEIHQAPAAGWLLGTGASLRFP